MMQNKNESLVINNFQLQMINYPSQELIIYISKLQKQNYELHVINQTYLRQIQFFENDNLEMYKIIQQFKLNQNCLETEEMTDKVKSQNSELVEIILYLQKKINVLEDRLKLEQISNIASKKELDQLQREYTAIVEKEAQNSVDLNKLKLRLLESEKYWLSRVESDIIRKGQEVEKMLVQKQNELNLKIQILKDELQFKTNLINQKDQQINILIRQVKKMSVS